jgi:NAD-dependent deacetylase
MTLDAFEMELIELGRAVSRARRVAVLTGAGVSTASGIPDFRSPGGLYADDRNANVFDIAEFKRDPTFFYDFARRFYPLLAKAAPAAAHRVLAGWTRPGRTVTIATQNIDDLHERAGSTGVQHVHGTVSTCTCQRCGLPCRTTDIEAEIFADGIPHCACGGVWKPDITFFGELLPEEAWDAASAAMREADLVLAVGTSLAVYPAASLPSMRPGSTPLAIINRDDTGCDDTADWVLQGDLNDILLRVDDYRKQFESAE